MRLLILGGTWFLGRAITADALAHGWQVTAFTRGHSGPPAPGVVHVRGDRTVTEDLVRLAEHGPWDATIDTCAYEPDDVLRVLGALGDGAGRYALISTASVYRDWPEQPVSEDSALWPLPAVPAESSYGTLKAGCERAAATASVGALIVRPGVILGPGEYVGRMLTLLGRAKRGGRWLLPAPADRAIQPIDVRDLSAFVLARIAADDTGTYNVTAPPGSATYGELIEACIAATGGTAEPVWADPDWLADQGVRQWTEIPLWLTSPGAWAIDTHRAASAGLTCRPLAQTVADTWADFQVNPPVTHPRQAEHGMDAAREQDLLTAWDAVRAK